jgi:hypothetical protein
MSQDAQGFSFVMLFLQAGQKVLSLGVVAQKERGGFRKGPLEVGALPIFLPDVPRRLPTDSWLHLTRRQYEANSCTLGNRSIWWIS